MIDVGTDRKELLDNPRYVGNRFARVRGERYDRFIDTFVHDCLELYPDALLHWEEFGRPTAAPILERYRGDVLTLNDDIQGTGVTVLAVLVAARRIAGTPTRIRRSSSTARAPPVWASPSSSTATVSSSKGRGLD